MAVQRRAARSRKAIGTARAKRRAVTKGTWAARRFWRTARPSALPRAEPVWRVVLSTPEAAPAWAGSTLRVAIVCIGDMVKPTPRPGIPKPGPRSYQWEAGPATRQIEIRPVAYRVNPVISRYLPPRSASLPTNGAENPEASEAGAMVRPALIALKPSTVCRYRVSGRAMPTRPIEMITLTVAIRA